jgi:hypothetical protein
VDVRFWFDPACPWCWITSHWIDEVAEHRDVTVDWRSISLKVRNEGRDLDPDYAKKVGPALERSHGLLRIVEAMREAGQADRIRDAYLAFGRHIHHDEDGLTFDIEDTLRKADVDPAFAGAYDDEDLDQLVRARTREAEDVAGDDVGTPIIAFEVDGVWRGYFGPVIPAVPDTAQALRLWDGLEAMVAVDGFYELKRTRTVGPDLDTVSLDR